MLRSDFVVKRPLESLICENEISVKFKYPKRTRESLSEEARTFDRLGGESSGVQMKI